MSDYGEVLAALKDPKTAYCAHRTGWNGKNMYIFLHFPNPHEICTLPYIVMKTAGGDYVPWLCSQTDAVAEDWEIEFGKDLDEYFPYCNSDE